MPLAVVGVSHHTAPVEIRERMAFGPMEASRALVALREEDGVEEAVLLSTCNRTEVYLHPARDRSVAHTVERLLERKSGRLERPVGEYLFQQWGEGVVRHLFQVVSGLDSLVTGEAEIQGQVRDAYERATGVTVNPPMAGPVLHRLFQMALSVGGEVRSRTAIGEGQASVASVSVELARKIFGTLRGKRVLVLGAGQTGELIVQALGREGAERVLVTNRTYDRAEALARAVGGQAVEFERMAEALSSSDIVLTSTAAPHPVLTRPRFREAFPAGANRPLLLIDIAVPRDVDPAVGEEGGVFLYNVDDLRKIVDEQLGLRAEEIPRADRIIRARSTEFRSWYASLEMVPVIRGMRRRAEDHRVSELERLLRDMEHVDEEDRARMKEFSRRLVNKILHDPTVRLRKGMGQGKGPDLVDAVRFLYGLEADDPPAPHAETDRRLQRASDEEDSVAPGGGATKEQE